MPARRELGTLSRHFPLTCSLETTPHNMITKTKEARTSFLNQNIIGYATIKVVGQDILFNL